MEYTYLQHVVVSVAESEVCVLFHNCQTAILIRNCLILMGHPQPPTPVKTENTTARDFTYNNIAIKKINTWDMIYYWIRDSENKLHFKIH